jgi:hypothetical protein
VTYTSPPHYRLVRLFRIAIIVHSALPRLAPLRVFPTLLTAGATLAALLSATRFSWTAALLLLPFGTLVGLVLFAGTPILVAVRHERLSFSVMTRLQLKRAA